MSTEALPGLSLRVAACRYAAIVADETTTHAERVKAWNDLDRAAVERRKATYCQRCNRHHEREGAAEEKCQRETQFARADHRRRGGTV